MNFAKFPRKPFLTEHLWATISDTCPILKLLLASLKFYKRFFRPLALINNTFFLFCSVSGYPAFLHKFIKESQWGSAVRLCRFVKVWWIFLLKTHKSYVWVVFLASMWFLFNDFRLQFIKIKYHCCGKNKRVLLMSRTPTIMAVFQWHWLDGTTSSLVLYCQK